jgi:hypothetical protein
MLYSLSQVHCRKGTGDILGATIVADTAGITRLHLLYEYTRVVCTDIRTYRYSP